MKKGISLVALVVTIIVLIILTAAVILTLVDTSILDKAENARDEQNKNEVYSLVQREVLNLQSEDYRVKVGQGFEDKLREKLKEKYPEAKTEVTLDGEKVKINYTLNNETYSLILDKEYKLTLDTNKIGNVETISKEKSYIGYYADIDGDKEPDGIIYADLAESKSEQWFDGDGTFSYQAKTGLKDYYISKKNHEGKFGTNDVLTAIGGGEDRFYVMALEDFNTGTYYSWYHGAYENISDFATVTLKTFGEGKTNTIRMIELWNDGYYGEKNANKDQVDIWGVIQEEVEKGWFVPSKEELSAFGYNLKITRDNYRSYGLSNGYTSSSLNSKFNAWNAIIQNGYMYYANINYGCLMRLSTTY